MTDPNQPRRVWQWRQRTFDGRTVRECFLDRRFAEWTDSKGADGRTVHLVSVTDGKLAKWIESAPESDRARVEADLAAWIKGTV